MLLPLHAAGASFDDEGQEVAASLALQSTLIAAASLPRLLLTPISLNRGSRPLCLEVLTVNLLLLSGVAGRKRRKKGRKPLFEEVRAFNAGENIFSIMNSMTQTMKALSFR